MHTRILYGYLVLTTGAHFAEFYVAREIALSIFVTLVAVRWVVVPMLCNCARRLGLNQGYDQGLEEAELIITAELEHHTTTTNGARAGAVAE